MRSSNCHHNLVIHTARKIQFYRVVGERLKAARERAGLSQTRLANLCQIATSTINNAEAGTTVPLYLVALIAETLDGVSIEELVPLVDEVAAAE